MDQAGVENLPRVHAYCTFHDLMSIKGSMRERCHVLAPALEEFAVVKNKVIRVIVCEQYQPLAGRLLAHPEDLVEMVKQMTKSESDSGHVAFDTDIGVMFQPCMTCDTKCSSYIVTFLLRISCTTFGILGISRASS